MSTQLIVIALCVGALFFTGLGMILALMCMDPVPHEEEHHTTSGPGWPE